MALVTGPLLSMSASGQIAKTQVYATWKGRPYVRRLVTPSNPKTTEQVLTRNTFTWLNNVWRLAPANVQNPWTEYARGQVMTNRNAWIKKNNGVLRDQTDLAMLTLSPGAKGGITVPVSITGGSGQLTITATAPSPLPSGWTVTKFVGVAIQDQDPQTGTFYEIQAGEDLTSAYSVVLTGLDPDFWAAGGWFVYQRSASLTDLAYGASTAELVTVT